MSVGSLSNPNVATIEPGAGIPEAAIAMREAHVGDLVVVERRGGRPVPVGVLTDRDLVIEVLAEKVDPKSVRVADIMSADVVTVRESNGLEFALREMEQRGLRRLPVVDGDGALVGIVSADDVVDHIARLAAHVAGAIRLEQYNEAKRRP